MRKRTFLWPFVALCLTVAPGTGFGDIVFAQTQPASAGSSQAVSPAPAAEQQGEQEPESDEPAPAVVELKISGSPLIVTLYEATRATKEKQILEKLEVARKLLEQNVDIQATDSFGRTALHWAVFGASYSIKPSVIAAYAKITDLLVSRGVDINHQDKYNDTALDYLLYSPNLEMQTLLLERGATSGFFIASMRFVEESQGDRRTGSSQPWWTNQVLAPGLIFTVRLSTPVWSDQSRTGDPVEAVVTAPLMTGTRVLLTPGTKIEGTVLLAQKAPDKYSRPRLVLDFSNIFYADGTKSALYSQVVAVDNARETVRNNEILGIIQPHASKKISLAFSAITSANPVASYAIKGIQTGYGLSLRREIHYPAGTDMTIQVTRPSKLVSRQVWAGWPTLAVNPDMQRLANRAPVRTERDKTPADITNLLFLGTGQDLLAAFEKAGWALADARGFSSDLKALQATVRESGYGGAPVSRLTLNGAPPDFVFQKSLNTFAKRHHVRVWRHSTAYAGQDVWVGAATHDIGIGSSAEGTKWFHRIDPRIDRERELIQTDLLFGEAAIGYALLDRPDVPSNSQNATGDDLITDGKVLVLALRPSPGDLTPKAQPR